MLPVIDRTTCKCCKSLEKKDNDKLQNLLLETFFKFPKKFHPLEREDDPRLDLFLLNTSHNTSTSLFTQDHVKITYRKLQNLFTNIPNFSYKTYFQVREIFKFTYSLFNILGTPDDLLIISIFTVLKKEINNTFENWELVYDKFPELVNRDYINKVVSLQNFICETYLDHYYPQNMFYEFISKTSFYFFTNILKLKQKRKSLPKTTSKVGFICNYEKLLHFYSCKVYFSIEPQQFLEYSTKTFYLAIFTFVLESLNKYFQSPDHFNSTIYYLLIEELNISKLKKLFKCIKKLELAFPDLIKY
jgi:hypothetical protein